MERIDLYGICKRTVPRISTYEQWIFGRRSMVYLCDRCSWKLLQLSNNKYITISYASGSTMDLLNILYYTCMYNCMHSVYGVIAPRNTKNCGVMYFDNDVKMITGQYGPSINIYIQYITNIKYTLAKNMNTFLRNYYLFTYFNIQNIHCMFAWHNGCKWDTDTYVQILIIVYTSRITCNYIAFSRKCAVKILNKWVINYCTGMMRNSHHNGLRINCSHDISKVFLKRYNLLKAIYQSIRVGASIRCDSHTMDNNSCLCIILCIICIICISVLPFVHRIFDTYFKILIVVNYVFFQNTEQTDYIFAMNERENILIMFVITHFSS